MPYSILKCPVCGSEYQIERNSYVCDRCGNILDVIQKDIANFKKTSMKGVWRYKEIVHPVLNNNQIITKMEGDTNIYHHPKLSEYSGIKNIYMKHEGENPTGSFKDRGMTVAVSEAIRQGFKKNIMRLNRQYIRICSKLQCICRNRQLCVYTKQKDIKK